MTTTAAPRTERAATAAPAQANPVPPLIVIEPEAGWVRLELHELWQYRDLLWLLAWRDIAARYRQSVIGYGWAVLKPVLSMVIFTFISRLAQIPSDGVPFQLFAYTAMLPWLYFSNTLVASTTSVVTSSNMLTKVYFPRMVLPFSSVVVGLVELAIQSIVLVGLIAYYNDTVVPKSADSASPAAMSSVPVDSPSSSTGAGGSSASSETVAELPATRASDSQPAAPGGSNASAASPTDAHELQDAQASEQAPRIWHFSVGWRTLCLPLFLVLCILTSLAVGLWLTALNVKYRDVGQAAPFLVQAWMFLSPVMYPSSLVSPELRPYYGLNPMAGVIEGFRWSILGTNTPDWTMMCVSASVVGLLLVSGLFYFRRIESTFADII